MNCTMWRFILSSSILLALGNVAACGSGGAETSEDPGSTGELDSASSGSTGDKGSEGSGGDDETGAIESSTGPAAECGDGVVDGDEECEPGAEPAGVGCAADCRFEYVQGWSAQETDRIYNAVTIDPEGNVFAAGYQPGRGDDDLIVQAYGPDGSPTWLYTWDSGSFDDEVATDVAMMPNGEVAVVGVGHANDFAFSEEIEVLRLDPETGSRNWGMGLPKLAAHSVPQGARVAVNDAGAMVVTYSESGQGSIAALNYVFFNEQGEWGRHERREDDRSFVARVVSGPDGQFAMLHWQQPPTKTDFVPGVEVYAGDGTFVSSTPLIAEGDYPLNDARGLAYAPDGSMRLAAWVSVVSLDADLANAWTLRFDEANTSVALHASVGPGGTMVFSGSRMQGGSFLASASADGQPGWYLPLNGNGAVSMARVGERAVLVGGVEAEGTLSSWVQRVEVRFGGG
jgi:cysteine-rich repeat protein